MTVVKRNSIVCAEFNGNEYEFHEDGWFNATAAAKRHGKEPSDWLALPSTKDYIAALDEESNAGKSGIWFRTKRGQGGGTWMHPELAVEFARWLDARFAVWCNRQIRALLAGEHPHFGRIRSRHAAAASNKYLRSMIERVREADGKDTKAHHFINECTLVNFIVSGEYVGLDRDAMPMQVLDFLAEAEGYNAMLYARGKSREDRIKMLAKFRRTWIDKHGELPALVLADHPKLEARTIGKGLTAAAKPRKLKAATGTAEAKSPEAALKLCAGYAANAPRVPDVREAAELRRDLS
ncbi:KilA-N domain-containing protein [Paraburkholderia heleia]|uniref:KilA-N domain-containing protein n=1 Tax=Paraburkholderia heleia TaxID=634127 RepID=UPI0006947E7B|nr:KilA-N domain-containing protein [Paraburkholderia heleia]